MKQMITTDVHDESTIGRPDCALPRILQNAKKRPRQSHVEGKKTKLDDVNEDKMQQFATPRCKYRVSKR